MSEQNQWEFPIDKKAITERLTNIDPVRYAKTRNFIDGKVTLLSPYISRGIITLPQVLGVVCNIGYPYRDIEKLLQELAWREFFQRVWFNKEQHIWSDLKQPQQKVLHHLMPEAIVKSSTGITAIDAQIEQLYATGYMHNHARMYVAGITCNMAGAYWLEPSRWMYYHLLDGDIASNTCSWQWVAGAFSSKKYIANQENINRYLHSHQRNSFLDHPYESIFDQPVPESLKATTALQLSTPLPSVDLPHLDPNKDLCIYTSYWLNPEWRSEEDVERVLLLEPSHFERYPVSEKVIQFVMDLAKAHIPNIKIYVGTFESLRSKRAPGKQIFFIDHPLHRHFSGVGDAYPWMFPEVKGTFSSFFGFWKKAERYARKRLEKN